MLVACRVLAATGVHNQERVLLLDMVLIDIACATTVHPQGANQLGKSAVPSLGLQTGELRPLMAACSWGGTYGNTTHAAGQRHSI